jgi:histidinol-phosphate aminotransferase
MTQRVAGAVLRHSDMLLAQAATIKSERANLLKQLAILTGVEVFPSDANFILFRVNQASDIFDALKQHGILIKILHGSHPLLTNCLRVTVGTPEENQQFHQALQTILR